MKMQWILVIAISLLTTVTAFAEQPATAPAGEEAAVLASFKAYNDAMMNGDTATMLKYNNATSDAEKKMAEAMVAGDVAIGKLKAAVDKAMGTEASKRVGKAVGDISNEDLKDAKVQVRGERATVVIGDLGGQRMIKVDGTWKFDLASPDAPADRVDALVNTYKDRVAKAEGVIADVNAGKFKSIDDLLAAIAEKF